MEFRIEDLAISLDAEIVRRLGADEMMVRIGGREHKLQIVSSDSSGVEFILDNSYHYARYVDVNSADMTMMVDGNTVTVSRFTELRAIAQKSSGAAAIGSGRKYLTSSIPGRVVSVLAKPKTEVKKGDVVVVLESMKMQVAIKAHKEGMVTEVRIKEGSNIARNDVVAVIE
ncbi:MAG: acetyl-CoA carboxylase biotin carboxyl carrier protein subunit [Nitrososphaerales archaeon]